MKFKYIFDKKELESFCELFSKNITKDDILFINGDLGSGKTFFIKTICFYLNPKNIVSSPTFVYYHKYIFENLNILHYDLYRFNNQLSYNDMITIDFFDSIDDGCVIVEWSNKISNNYINKEKILYIDIDFSDKNDHRKFDFYTNNNKWYNFFINKK